MKSSEFSKRHIGPTAIQQTKMLNILGLKTLEDLTSKVIPKSILNLHSLNPKIIGEGKSEFEALNDMKDISKKNQVSTSFFGAGYYDCITPPVILRNLFENPGWYTQYTPYQAEIAQGRLESLLNFQTMISSLTDLPMSNASLLDEGTAAAEAMAMMFALSNRDLEKSLFLDRTCHPQTLCVVETRAKALGIKLVIDDPSKIDFKHSFFGSILQNPNTFGNITNYTNWIQTAHVHHAYVCVITDPMALMLFKTPGEMGADIAVGTTQRFGVPMGCGGPHAAFMACKDEFKRLMPGRIVGVSKDSDGNPAIRLALQTREQHIRRDKATSNICTAQALLANIAAMYALYHGPLGLREIALKIHKLSHIFGGLLKEAGVDVQGEYFDTLVFNPQSPLADILKRADEKNILLRTLGDSRICISFDECKTDEDLASLFYVVTGKQVKKDSTSNYPEIKLESKYLRATKPLEHPIFSLYHSETEMMRYLTRLQCKDLSLTHSMIPLGSCTMKLNAAAEMIPVSWPEFSKIHPFENPKKLRGYQELITNLEKWLADITGFDAISLQPNAGSQGEFAGLLVIKKYFQSIGQSERNTILIPQSAHGTNPASAAMAGFKVVVVKCDTNGNIDLDELKALSQSNAKSLAGIMVTYPSTHGVFEEGIIELCEVIHSFGGQVYFDGANMNAQVGLCRPADFGADVCHLNLHKTFAIPHGGGGPGMGPIGVKKHLGHFLPSHPLVTTGPSQSAGVISAAPYGSASILPVSYLYIQMMGVAGLQQASQVAILNANYIAKKLDPYFPVLYRGKQGFVAHECIIDMRPFKNKAGIEVDDIAKRLMDYGFHSPTVSFPVAGTMMIEPTESEGLEELDRFCEAMISIHSEIIEVESGKADRINNILKKAPHTASQIAQDNWDRSYSRKRAAFPLKWVEDRKIWPSVSRIDAVFGERNLVCSCLPIEAYIE